MFKKRKQYFESPVCEPVANAWAMQLRAHNAEASDLALPADSLEADVSAREVIADMMQCLFYF